MFSEHNYGFRPNRSAHDAVREAKDYIQEGNRVMNSMTSFIEGKLKLKMNLNKSAVDRLWNRKFFGFSFTFHKEPKVRLAKESVKRMKNKIREITSRKKPYPLEYRIMKLNQYLMG